MSAPLGFVVCGAPLAVRAPDVARTLVADSQSLAVAVSAAATGWVDPDTLAKASHRLDATPQRMSEERRQSRPDRVAAFPLTFNTANKITAGIMGTYATGKLCNALGIGASILAVPMVNNRLRSHPVWSETPEWLTNAGVRFLDPRSGDVGAPQPVPSGNGADVIARFQPTLVFNAVADLSS